MLWGPSRGWRVFPGPIQARQHSVLTLADTAECTSMVRCANNSLHLAMCYVFFVFVNHARFYGPRLWNSQPQTLSLRRPDVELSEFRRLLKTYFVSYCSALVTVLLCAVYKLTYYLTLLTHSLTIYRGIQWRHQNLGWRERGDEIETRKASRGGMGRVYPLCRLEGWGISPQRGQGGAPDEIFFWLWEAKKPH